MIARAFGWQSGDGSANRKATTSFTGSVSLSCPVELSQVAFHSTSSPSASRAGSPAGAVRYCSPAETGNSIGVVSLVPQDARKHASNKASGGNFDNLIVPRTVTWDNKAPGSGPVYLCDPVLSADPALRNLVFVALIQQTGLGTTRVNSAFKLWWLQMDDDTSTIIASGRLLTAAGSGRE